MSDLRRAAQAVIQAWDDPAGTTGVCRALDVLRAALAEPVQEPVAYRFKSPLSEEGQWEYGKEPPVGSRWEIEPLYAAPPQRQPLHDMNVLDIADLYLYNGGKVYSVLGFARAIERAHGIGGNE